ncbi:MAG: flagellar hook assembly protein FlgD, partial [Planctomycetota bacterium]
MAISPVAGATGASANIMADYLKLLVTQLQNQNPLEPMNNSEMTAQLAALSQLEQLESISSTFEKVLVAQQFAQAGAMVGRRVVIPTEDGEGIEGGTVVRADIVDGQPQLVVDVERQVVRDGELVTVRQDRAVGFEEVLSIGDVVGAQVPPAESPAAL